jgi:hypothetical protein
MTDKDFLPHTNGAWDRIIHELRRRLDELAARGHSASREIADLQNNIHDLEMHQKGQLTHEQVVSVILLLLMNDRRKWLRRGLKVYGASIVGIIAGIFVFRIWIADIFQWLASLARMS